MNHFAAVFLIGISTLASNLAFADQPKPVSDSDVIAEVQKTDEARIRAAGLQTADQIGQMPGKLRENGVDVTNEEQARFKAAAEQLANEANQPGFKEKVIRSLKKSRHGLSRAGIETLKGLGYSGDAVFWACLSPMAFGADLVTGAVLGRGVVSTGSKNGTEDTLAGLGGTLTLGYTYTGLYAIGFTLYAPILATSLGVETVDAFVCQKADDAGTTERDRFCHNNEAIRRVIVGHTARAGEIVGDGIHTGVMKTVHAIEYPFRHRSDSREDDMGN